MTPSVVHCQPSLQEGQKLMVDFAEYPSVIVRNLNHCIKEPHSVGRVQVESS
jgi:hypothetical protein